MPCVVHSSSILTLKQDVDDVDSAFGSIHNSMLFLLLIAVTRTEACQVNQPQSPPPSTQSTSRMGAVIKQFAKGSTGDQATRSRQVVLTPLKLYDADLMC